MLSLGMLDNFPHMLPNKDSDWQRKLDIIEDSSKKHILQDIYSKDDQ